MTQDPGSGSPMSERMQSLLSRAVEDQLSEQRQVAGALTEVHAQLTRIADRLDALQSPTGAAGGGDELAGELREAVRLLGERIDRVDAGIAAGLERAEAHDAALRELRQAFTGVAARAAQLPGREDIDALVGRVTAPIVELGNRLERVEASLVPLLERPEAPDAGDRPLPASISAGSAGEELGARAVAASEQRLTAHIDEAVLALAEALLRRRTRTSARPTVPPVAPPVAAPSATRSLLDEGDIDTDLGDEDDEDEVDAITEFRASSPTLFEPAGVSGDEVSGTGTEVGADPGLESPDDGGAGDADATRKRKPWWRPGG